MALTDRDRAILDLERSWWTESAPKESVIRARLGMSSTRYYEVLGILIQSPDAMAHDPLLVRRLRRTRVLRRRARLEGRPAIQPRGR